MLRRYLKTQVFAFTAGLLATGSLLQAADWPMWRHDASRSGRTSANPPEKLKVLWQRQLPHAQPAFRSSRLQFDRGVEPVVQGKTLVYASALNDRVTGLDTDSGRERWRFYTEGPVRFAPVCWRESVFVASDDGHLYSLDLENGSLRWKFRAVPSHRRIFGNRRLISAWPLRGGPVVHDGVLYFAAGVWSFEGVFVYALDASSGKVRWRNDRAAFVYGAHPHGAEGFGGLTPQGYLVVAGDDLIVPCGTAYPATFDRHNGTLKSFELPARGRFPGGWFAFADSKEAKDRRRGKVQFDRDVNSQRHEDNLRHGSGVAGAASTVEFGGHTRSYKDPIEGVEGDLHSLIAADDKIFAVSRDARLYALGEATSEAVVHDSPIATLRDQNPEWEKRVSRLLEVAPVRQGHALVVGVGSGYLIDELCRQTRLQLIVVEPDPTVAASCRRRLDAAGFYGTRVTVLGDALAAAQLPRYFARLVVSETAEDLLSDLGWYEQLRPYGGVACVFDQAESEAEPISRRLEDGGFVGAHTAFREDALFIERRGPLPGATNYTGGWQSADELVRAPLGVLWFDDSLGHFKRSPQPHFVDGIMVSRPKDWHEDRGKEKRGYYLLPRVLSDVYTGRILNPDENGELDVSIALGKLPADVKKQPIQYRPSTQEDAWRPKPPVIGMRVNPITLGTEPRAFPKSYGCDGGIDYGHVFTMRSATASYYDKRSESGTINISGPRSGCTNSLVPACGVLNAPYFYEGCTCSYPLPSGLALVSMPETFEQWSAWGPADLSRGIRRVGMNFGAPGDRVTRDGTLWLEAPVVGGDSPKLESDLEPKNVSTIYEHSVWITGGRGWPWVASSACEGLERWRLRGLSAERYLVRLYFCELQADTQPDARVFDVVVAGRKVLEDFSPVAAAGGTHRAFVHELPDFALDGEFELVLEPKVGKTIISGVELIDRELSPGVVPTLGGR